MMASLVALFAWGAPRIHGELQKLGFDIAQSTVGKYLALLRRPRGPSSQTWRTFLANHHAPWQNPFVERLIGSIRRECFDHLIIWNERGLRRHLHDYLTYYHHWRTHLSLDKDAPFHRPLHLPSMGSIVEVAHLGGLQHHYERRAA